MEESEGSPKEAAQTTKKPIPKKEEASSAEDELRALVEAQIDTHARNLRLLMGDLDSGKTMIYKHDREAVGKIHGAFDQMKGAYWHISPERSDTLVGTWPDRKTTIEMDRGRLEKTREIEARILEASKDGGKPRVTTEIHVSRDPADPKDSRSRKMSVTQYASEKAPPKTYTDTLRI